MFFNAARSTQRTFKSHQGVTTHSFIMAYLLPSEHGNYLLLLLNVSMVAVYLRHHRHNRHDHLSFRLLDLEDAAGPSIFVLVPPDHGVPSDNTVESILGDLPLF